MTDKVRFELRGHVALLTLDDPTRRNALSRQIVRGLRGGLTASVKAGARAVVIAANGAAFCAGANIDDLRDGWMEGTDPEEDPALLFRQLVEFDRPVFAAVQGAAVGGGMELALACDIVLATDSAWFAMPELSHGVIPNTGLALLPRAVGTRRALDLILTRRRVPASEAVAIGLASRLASPDRLLDEAFELAQDVVGKAPPGAIKAARSNLYAHADIDWPRVLRSPLDVPAAEWREGLDAFTEKRIASFDRFWTEANSDEHKRSPQ